MKSNFKTFIFLVVLTVLFILVGQLIGGTQGAIIAFFIALAMNLFTYWFSDRIVLRRYSAREVARTDNSRLYNIVENLALKADLPMPKVYIIPDRTPNAFATGRNPSHAAVAATEGILQILNDEELAGVMAHELTHVKNRDTLTSTVAATIVGAITMLGQMGRYSASSRNRNPLILIAILLVPFAALLIRMAISRVREYAADEGGALISGKPLGLANALAKLSRGVVSNPIRTGNPADSHLFIVNPFMGGLQNLLSTHPPMEERVKRLKDMKVGY
ncbi:MAG: zinc metalloprotease HtpX [Bacteroidales bacterium]|jgi:heat shock protein HtpX|nr:zinc metalloprotease HtpX [Bacteroidales bacterium]